MYFCLALVHLILTYTIDLGRAGEGLNNVNFKIFDIDGEIGRFLRQEKYVITGYLDSDVVNPYLSGSSIHTIAGNKVLGNSPTDPSGCSSADGVLI